MTSKTSSVRSIRLPNEVWARLEQEAAEQGVTVNALVARRVGGQPGRPGTAPPKAVEAANKALREAKVKLSLPVGPVTPAAGSRLKGAK